MPCNDSTEEMEGTDLGPTLTAEDGQLVPFNSLMQPTDLPALIDNGNGDSIITTFLDAPDAETGEDYPQATITITQKVTVTVTVTMTPGTLATLSTLGARVETATSTVTAAPLGRVSITAGTAVGVPIACIFGTGALMLGLFCWYCSKRSISNKRRLEAAVAALGYSDHSIDDPTAPIAIPRPRGGGGPGGILPGTVAPPSSLDSEAAVPHGDLDTRFGHAHALRIPDDFINYVQGNESENSGYLSGYGTMPQTGANNYIGRTVVYASPSNEEGGTGPMIRAAQTAPLRAIEISGHGHTSQRASIVEVSEEQESNIRASSIVPDIQERGDIAELEGSPVPRRFSATSMGQDAERASINSDDSGARTLGRNSSIEVSADHRDLIHELASDGAAAPAGIEQNDDNEQAGDKVDIQKATQAGVDTKEDDKAGQGAESSSKQ